MRGRTKLVAMTVLLGVALIINTGIAGAEKESRWVTKDRLGNPDAKLSLSWWVIASHYHQSPYESRNVAWNRLYSSWVVKHPNVKIDITPIPGAKIHEMMMKLLQAAAAGRAPDMAEVDSFFVPRFVLAKTLQPLNQFLSEEETNDFFKFTRDVVTDKEGNVRALWWDTDMRALYYRKDLVPTPPRTWDELIKVASNISKTKGIAGYVYNGARWEATTFDNIAMFWAQGGRLVDEVGKPIFNEGENREYMLNLFRFLKRTVDSGASPPRVVDIKDYADMNAEAKAGATAMFLGGNWQIGQLMEILSPEEFKKWDVALIPQKTADITSTGTGGWTFGIFTTDPVKQREAFNFLWAAYASRNAMAAACQAGGYLPTRKSVYQDFHFFKADPWNQKWAEMLKYGRARPGFPIYPTISEHLQIAIGAVLIGIKSPEVALDDAWTEVLREYERIKA